MLTGNRLLICSCSSRACGVGGVGYGMVFGCVCSYVLYVVCKRVVSTAGVGKGSTGGQAVLAEIKCARFSCTSGWWGMDVKSYYEIGVVVYCINMCSPVFRESILRSIGNTLSLAKASTRSRASRFCGFAA